MMPDALPLLAALLLLLLPVVVQINARTEDSAHVDKKSECVDRPEITKASAFAESVSASAFSCGSYRAEGSLDSVNAP